MESHSLSNPKSDRVLENDSVASLSLERIRALEYENSILLTNISTLYYTARQELEEKNKYITSLQKQIALLTKE